MTSRAPIETKLELFYVAVVTSATYGCGEWTLTPSTLAHIRKWELHMLRKVFRLKRREGRDIAEYFRSTAKYIKKAFVDHGRVSCCELAIKGYIDGLWRAKSTKDQHNNPLVDDIREYKNRLWWVPVNGRN